MMTSLLSHVPNTETCRRLACAFAAAELPHVRTLMLRDAVAPQLYTSCACDGLAFVFGHAFFVVSNTWQLLDELPILDLGGQKVRQNQREKERPRER